MLVLDGEAVRRHQGLRKIALVEVQQSWAGVSVSPLDATWFTTLMRTDFTCAHCHRLLHGERVTGPDPVVVYHLQGRGYVVVADRAVEIKDLGIVGWLGRHDDIEGREYTLHQEGVLPLVICARA